MPNKRELQNKKFGKLFVVKEFGKNKHGSYTWECLCDCGQTVIVSSNCLITKDTQSCGCLHKTASITHGRSKTRLYWCWQNIKARCYYEGYLYYKNYGGRGIRVCDEWKDSFESFKDWALSNEYSEELTIDRINNNGNYEPSNCRFITNTEQQSNKTSNNWVILGDKIKTITQWSRYFNINITTLKRKIEEGLSEGEIFLYYKNLKHDTVQ